MNPTVVNSQSGTSLGGNPVVNKPTGLAVGDWLIWYIFAIDTSALTLNAPSGWTKRGEASMTTSSEKYAVFTKIADSGDVAASTFTYISGADVTIAHMAAVRDVGLLNSFEIDNNTPSSTSMSFTANSTPVLTNSLALVSFAAYSGSGSTTLSNYSTTPSATFTELLDTFVDISTTDPVMGLASATLTSISTITNYSATLSVSKGQHGGSLIIFTPINSPVVDISHVAVTPAIEGITASVNVTADIAHQNIPVTQFSIAGKSSSDGTQWTNPDKPSTSWINPDK